MNKDMARIAGIQYKADRFGTIYEATVNYRRIKNKRIAEMVEDLLDIIEIESMSEKDRETVSWEDVRNKLDKKHGI
jgi:hypothetical protein